MDFIGAIVLEKSSRVCWREVEVFAKIEFYPWIEF